MATHRPWRRQPAWPCGRARAGRNRNHGKQEAEALETHVHSVIGTGNGGDTDRQEIAHEQGNGAYDTASGASILITNLGKEDRHGLHDRAVDGGKEAIDDQNRPQKETNRGVPRHEHRYGTDESSDDEKTLELSKLIAERRPNDAAEKLPTVTIAAMKPAVATSMPLPS